MAVGSEFPGRRREDCKGGRRPDDHRPGDYWRIVDAEGKPVIAQGSLEAATARGNLTGGEWGGITPTGLHVWLSYHTVREHEDGTISVRPGDGSSNSILSHGHGDRASWHGYIDHGVWQEV